MKFLSGDGMKSPVAPKVPFVWPEPIVSSGLGEYVTRPPFDSKLLGSGKMFGVMSSPDSRTIKWIKKYLAENSDTKLRIVISVYPTCVTSRSEIEDLIRVAETHGDRAAFKIYPEESLADRSSNCICLIDKNEEITIATGPTENLGFDMESPSQANFVAIVSVSVLEKFRKWFDYLWGISGLLDPDVALLMPTLVIPEGDREATRLWDAYRQMCLSNRPVVVSALCQESGEFTLLDQFDQLLPSPTEEINVPKLDAISDFVSNIYQSGSLVTYDKHSRIPPLEAPVKPEWFGVDSFRKTGVVKAQTSMKVSPFDENTIKKIDRLRRVSAELLPRYSFGLADGVRWIPTHSIRLFEAALNAANHDAKTLLGDVIGGDIVNFFESRRVHIRSDAQRMYHLYHPAKTIPDESVEKIMGELKNRLDRTQAEKILPSVAYARLSFNPTQSSEWASPWGQAFALLKEIAEYPREAMTNRFFWQGFRGDEDELIKAMNVAGDYLIKDYGSRNAIRTADAELSLIKQLGDFDCEPIDKCRALWALITQGEVDGLSKLLRGI